jgi:hypothetical protein
MQSKGSRWINCLMCCDTSHSVNKIWQSIQMWQEMDKWNNRKHTKQRKSPYRKLVLHMHIQHWHIMNQYHKWSYKCHDFLNQEWHWHFQWRFWIRASLSIGGSFRTKVNLECEGGEGGGSYSFISILPLGWFSRNQSCQATGMAVAHCILAKFLGVGCHSFTPSLDVPTFSARCLHVQRRGTLRGREMFWQISSRIRLPRNSRDLLHAANLRHGTDCFTSPPKEGALRNFSLLKIRRLQPGLNPQTWVPKASTLPPDHRSWWSHILGTSYLEEYLWGF